MTSIAVNYAANQKVLMVSPSSWTATGPSQWFNDYRILSTMPNYLDDRLHITNIRDLVGSKVHMPSSAIGILDSNFFNTLISEEKSLQGYRILLDRSYKSLKNDIFLANDPETSERYENKVWFRNKFAHQLPFPRFLIVPFKEMKNSSFTNLSTDLQCEAIVVQQDRLSAGVGTYIIRSEEQLKICLNELSKIANDTDKLVVSEELRNFKERTVQACVTADEILVGPPQSQIIGHPSLVSSAQGAMKFCGGRIDQSLVSSLNYEKITDYVKTIGRDLMATGYRGIFGVDFLMNHNAVYVLEVNPRLTALTTLLAFLQKDIPFLLIHTLELLKSPYTITMPISAARIGNGSFVLVQAQQDGAMGFMSGEYTRKLKRISSGFADGTILPVKADNYFVGTRVPQGARFKSGKTLAFIYSRRQLFNDSGSLDSDVIPLIEAIRGH